MPINPDWQGETAFIIGGGPSVKTLDLEQLRGRRVIVINSSIEVCPWADVLFFGDSRWGRLHRAKLKDFAGRILTGSHAGQVTDRVEILHKNSPPGLTRERNAITMRRTSLTGAINVAVHFGVSGIVLIGADGGYGPDGETHHHDPHPWPHRPGCWDLQRKELETIVEPLNALGVKVINANPESAWDMWPRMTLDEAIREMDGNGLAGGSLRQSVHQPAGGECIACAE